MVTPYSREAVSRPRRGAGRVFFAIFCAGLVLAVVIFFGVGSWLVVEDPLVKSKAIVVLSGSMPMRAVEAVRLYRAGYAPEIWLTRSAEPGETLKGMGI